jgi:hypothetical protein
MDFRVADTFTSSLARLTGPEQKAVKAAAFELQIEPSGSGFSFHKLDRAADKNFWSARVNADLRMIVHRLPESLLLAYVAHHDDAYKWAERRKLERHPTTGAMQLVEVGEVVREAPIEPAIPPAPIEAVEPNPFVNLRKYELMAFGVPEEWVDPVREATEATLLDTLSHLPQEAAEALLRLAVGEKPEPPAPQPAEADPFEHPDAQRRFRLFTTAEELRQALDYPWEKWAVFLHPAQRALVERKFSGPARVSGSAGTGKTIVALHRAAHLARANPAARILLTTFSKPLANMLAAKLALLLGNDPSIAERINVRAITAVGYDLYSRHFGQPEIAPPALIRNLLVKAAADVPGYSFSPHMLFGEWSDVVDAWQLTDWEGYRDVSRLGRKTRIGGKQREALWDIFSRVRAGLAERKVVTWATVFGRLTDQIEAGLAPPFDHVVTDEAQDIGVAEARFLSAVAGTKPDGLFFAGDLGQRIFQQPFSWRSLGLDVRGRSATLRVNYRTSQQIRQQADRLLPDSVADVDGNTEGRRGTVSLFEGPSPRIEICASEADEAAVVSAWLVERVGEGLAPEQIAVFVRSQAELRRAREALKMAKVAFVELTEKVEVADGAVALSTMHFAKGLEFRAVAVMACDDEVIPSQERIESVADNADLEEVYDSERQLLYVACTRARESLLVTGVVPASEFLHDLTN